LALSISHIAFVAIPTEQRITTKTKRKSDQQNIQFPKKNIPKDTYIVVFT